MTSNPLDTLKEKDQILFREKFYEVTHTENNFIYAKSSDGCGNHIGFTSHIEEYTKGSYCYLKYTLKVTSFNNNCKTEILEKDEWPIKITNSVRFICD